MSARTASAVSSAFRRLCGDGPAALHAQREHPRPGHAQRHLCRHPGGFVYAIDADTGAQLWYASMLNAVARRPAGYLPCGTGPGYTRKASSDPGHRSPTNTMYLVAKTLLNTTVRHHLHAIDITTGNEQAGSPVLITATSTSNKGHVTVFNSKHQKNRPGLLLFNGVLYLGFGSNSCNDGSSGWVLSYDAASLSQLAVFNTSPDYGLASIWQPGWVFRGRDMPVTSTSSWRPPKRAPRTTSLTAARRSATAC